MLTKNPINKDRFMRMEQLICFRPSPAISLVLWLRLFLVVMGDTVLHMLRVPRFEIDPRSP